MTPMEVAFPKLSQDEIDLLKPFYTIEKFEHGHVLFLEGDSNFKFYTVKKGRIDIYESSSGVKKFVAHHNPGEFLGDVDLMTGRAAMVSAETNGETELYSIPAPSLQDIFSQVPDVGEKIIKAFIMRRQLLRDMGFTGVKIVGSRYSADTFRIKDFLSKNRVPYTWLDIDSDLSMLKFFEKAQFKIEETPVVICGQDRMLKNPSESELAQCLGIKHKPAQKTYDLVIAGGGPAGLAAAVYAASEGLRTIMIDATAPGGQAGTSSKIENYLGFPTGISGSDLAARAIIQANKFGAEILSPARILSYDRDGNYNVLSLDDKSQVSGRSLVIATGAVYKRLPLKGIEKFDGVGIYYGATSMEAQLCDAEDVVIVGGGNSAGQAAMFLSNYARRVYILIRRDTLSETMSKYLSERILHTSHIELLKNTEIDEVRGTDKVNSVVIKNNKTGEKTEVKTHNVFVFIGADPKTEWLKSHVATDRNGFILTGAAMKESDSCRWSLERDPYFLESSVPGVFAVGDVRARSIKRVASAVGEGSMAIQLVHQYLSS